MKDKQNPRVSDGSKNFLTHSGPQWPIPHATVVIWLPSGNQRWQVKMSRSQILRFFLISGISRWFPKWFSYGFFPTFMGFPPNRAMFDVVRWLSVRLAAIPFAATVQVERGWAEWCRSQDVPWFRFGGNIFWGRDGWWLMESEKQGIFTKIDIL
jgi:hypothetical protein